MLPPVSEYQMDRVADETRVLGLARHADIGPGISRARLGFDLITPRNLTIPFLYCHSQQDSTC